MPGSSAYPAALDELQTDVTSAQSAGTGDHHAENHNAANAAIIAVQTALGTDPQGSEADVAARLAAIESALGGAAVVTDVYTTGTHTWTKATGAKQVDVILVGAGGPGASGGCGAVNTTKNGGGGGGAGAIVVWSFDASELPSSVEVAVGSSTGGAAVGPTAANGNTPTQPVDTTFGAILKAKAGLVGNAAGPGGASQSVVSITRGLAAWNSPAGGSSGMPSAAVSAITPGAPTSGGGGAGVWNSGISYAGGDGGSWSSASSIFPGLAAASGGAIGSAGAAGGQSGFAGLGGGGGGSSHTGPGGAGGAGGFPGGGGGGGGACWAGYTSGAGGAGGAGLCIVIQRL